MKKLIFLAAAVALIVCAALPCLAASEPPPVTYLETVTREPTCSLKGIKTFINPNDPSDSFEESIPALGHQFGDAKQKENGMQVRLCRRCGYEDALVLNPPAPPIPRPGFFNSVDAVLGGVNFLVIALFAILLFPVIREVKRERKAYQAYNMRRSKEEQEAAGHSFT